MSLRRQKWGVLAAAAGPGRWVVWARDRNLENVTGAPLPRRELQALCTPSPACRHACRNHRKNKPIWSLEIGPTSIEEIFIPENLLKLAKSCVSEPRYPPPAAGPPRRQLLRGWTESVGLALRQLQAQGRQWASRQGPPARILTLPARGQEAALLPAVLTSPAGMSPSAPALPQMASPCLEEDAVRGATPRVVRGGGWKREHQNPQELTSCETARGRSSPRLPS